ALMVLWKDVNFVGHPGSERYVGHKLLIFGYHAVSLIYRYQHRTVGVINLVLIIEELIELAAPDTPLAVCKVLLCVVQLVLERIGDDRSGDDLGVRVSQRSAGGLAMVLEQQDVLEFAVPLE